MSRPNGGKPHLHFMGVGGVGMSGLARWCQQDGYRVSGCDQNESSEVLALRSQGIAVEIGHDAAHLQGVDQLVSTMAVSADNAELGAARAHGITCLHRIELLSRLLERHQGVTVTGTHGKSTTTGMIAHILRAVGLDPSVLIGGHLSCLDGNVAYGRGDLFVTEVDESDPGFARLKSRVAVITNLQDDHVAGEFDERRNYHASMSELEAAMRAFAGSAERVLYCADWPGLVPLLGDVDGALTYGLSAHSSYRAKGATLRGMTSVFTFVGLSRGPLEVALPIPGNHNVQNATAALAVADTLGIDLDAAATALAEFPGVGRRMQRRGSVANALVLDDYAVHPTEVEVVLTVARDTGRRVRAVLQPHRWVRTARHWRALADAASLADEVIVLDIYSAGEAPIAGVSARLIVERLRQTGKRVSYHDIASAQDYLEESLAENDLVITLGAGDVWKVAEGLVRALGGDDGTA